MFVEHLNYRLEILSNRYKTVNVKRRNRDKFPQKLAKNFLSIREKVRKKYHLLREVITAKFGKLKGEHDALSARAVGRMYTESSNLNRSKLEKWSGALWLYARGGMADRVRFELTVCMNVRQFYSQIFYFL